MSFEIFGSGGSAGGTKKPRVAGSKVRFPKGTIPGRPNVTTGTVARTTRSGIKTIGINVRGGGTFKVAGTAVKGRK